LDTGKEVDDHCTQVDTETAQLINNRKRNYGTSVTATTTSDDNDAHSSSALKIMKTTTTTDADSTATTTATATAAVDKTSLVMSAKERYLARKQQQQAQHESSS
jgi:uncharacterized protein YcnI